MAIDAQAKIDALETIYDTLAAKNLASGSVADRNVVLLQMKDVRAEIVYWENRLNRSTRAASTFTRGRPVR